MRRKLDHITLPAIPPSSLQQEAQSQESQEKQSLEVPPRPPVPPRRHTLAEICRYADEQCAYIEWMTRQFEAEEALRRRSSPTTPLGAITNPFNGPADMWWRPPSAKDMYGKSELRCRQEAEANSTEHPYLATDISELLKPVESEFHREPEEKDTEIVVTTVEIAPSPAQLPLELCAEHLADGEAALDESEGRQLDTSDQIKVPAGECQTEPSRTSSPIAGQSVREKATSSRVALEKGSLLFMIPKALLYFLLGSFITVLGTSDGEFAIERDEVDEG